MKNQTESREEEVRQDWRLRQTVPRCKIYQLDGATRGIRAASVIAHQRTADSNLLPRMHLKVGDGVKGCYRLQASFPGVRRSPARFVRLRALS